MPEATIDGEGASALIDSIKGLIDSSARSVELEIKNKTGKALSRFGSVTGNDGCKDGSGYWAKKAGPGRILDIGDEEICGCESNGAGAVGLVGYWLPEENILFEIYFASPLSTSNGVVGRILDLSKYTSKKLESQGFRDDIFEADFSNLDSMHRTTESTTSDLGYAMVCDLTGSDNCTVEVTIALSA